MAGRSTPGCAVLPGMKPIGRALADWVPCSHRRGWEFDRAENFRGVFAWLLDELELVVGARASFGRLTRASRSRQCGMMCDTDSLAIAGTADAARHGQTPRRAAHCGERGEPHRPPPSVALVSRRAHSVQIVLQAKRGRQQRRLEPLCAGAVCEQRYLRVPATIRYSCSKRACSGVPRFHSSQNPLTASTNSASWPFLRAFAWAVIVGPYFALKCSP